MLGDPLLMTALLPLAALGLQAASRALARHGQALAVSVVGAAMVVSFVELSIHPAKPRFRTVPTPPEYSVVDKTRSGIFAEYPLGQSDIYRFWQRKYGRPLAERGAAGHAGRLRAAHAARSDPTGHCGSSVLSGRHRHRAPPRGSRRRRGSSSRPGGIERLPPRREISTRQVDLVSRRGFGLGSRRSSGARARHVARRVWETTAKFERRRRVSTRLHLRSRSDQLHGSRGRDRPARLCRNSPSEQVSHPAGCGLEDRAEVRARRANCDLGARCDPTRSVSAVAQDRPGSGLARRRPPDQHAASRARLRSSPASCGSRVSRSRLLTAGDQYGNTSSECPSARATPGTLATSATFTATFRRNQGSETA